MSHTTPGSLSRIPPSAERTMRGIGTTTTITTNVSSPSGSANPIAHRRTNAAPDGGVDPEPIQRPLLSRKSTYPDTLRVRLSGGEGIRPRPPDAGAPEEGFVVKSDSRLPDVS